MIFEIPANNNNLKSVTIACLIGVIMTYGLKYILHHIYVPVNTIPVYKFIK